MLRWIYLSLLCVFLTTNQVFAQEVAHVVSMNPISGQIGDSVSITVAGPLDPKITLDFNGIASTASVQTSSLNQHIVKTTVPNAESGPVHLTLSDKTVLDAGVFTIIKKINPRPVTVDDPIQGPSSTGGNGRSNPPTTTPLPVPTPLPSAPSVIIDPLMDLPIGKPTEYNAIAIPSPVPTPSTPPEEAPPTIYGHDLISPNHSIIYVIDISGSMGWDMGQYTTVDGHSASGCRLDRAKAELVRSVTSLPIDFKFNIFAFDCDLTQWQGQSVQATDPNKQSAVEYIMALQPEGGTGTGPAVSAALGDKTNKLLVLLTDGQPNCGSGNGLGDTQCIQSHLHMIDSNNNGNAIINVFAIGATDEFEAFCQAVARDNGGSCADVR